MILPFVMPGNTEMFVQGIIFQLFTEVQIGQVSIYAGSVEVKMSVQTSDLACTKVDMR